MKQEDIRQVALSKVQHLFSNIHIQQKVQSEMNNKTVSLVRKWFGLNIHSTRDIIFHPQWEGGLGVPNVIWIYTSMWISHLLNMLNNDDKDVRELARSSLFLDLRCRWPGSQSPTSLVSKGNPAGNWILILLVLVSGQIGRTWMTSVFELEYYWSGWGLTLRVWESRRISSLTPWLMSGQQPHTVVIATH